MKKKILNIVNHKLTNFLLKKPDSCNGLWKEDKFSIPQFKTNRSRNFCVISKLVV